MLCCAERERESRGVMAAENYTSTNISCNNKIVRHEQTCCSAIFSSSSIYFVRKIIVQYIMIFFSRWSKKGKEDE